MFLTQLKCQVDYAVDGFDCLEKVTQFEPDLILLDVMLPRLNGLALLKLIRRNSKFAKIPVVMMSSNNSVYDKAAAATLGASAYIGKPFTKLTLHRMLTRFLPRHNTGVRPEASTPSIDRVRDGTGSPVQPVVSDTPELTRLLAM